MSRVVHHMRDNDLRYGLQTRCEGGARGVSRSRPQQANLRTRRPESAERCALKATLVSKR